MKEKLFHTMVALRRYHILPRTETAEQIAAGKSVSRFGDGEFGLLFDRPIGFQRCDATLKERLAEVLLSAKTGAGKENLLICIPGALNNVDNMQEKPKSFWTNWAVKHRRELAPYLSKNYVYGDSLVTRLWMAWKDKSHEPGIVETVQRVFADRDVVVVEGSGTRFGDGNDLLDGCRSVRRIICPEKDAFEKYDEILSTCLNLAGGGYYLLSL